MADRARARRCARTGPTRSPAPTRRWPPATDAFAFLRGDAVLAAAALRDDAGGAVDVPAGTWRDVLAGGERHIAGVMPAAELLGEHGVALFERVVKRATIRRHDAGIDTQSI